MKTSVAISVGYQCPVCTGRLSRDFSNKGFVRHLDRKPDGTLCTIGMGESDVVSRQEERGNDLQPKT